MAGHSKWSNIKRKKEKNDAQKAKVFTKVGREISVAVREGGADPDQNSRLKDLISKAKTLNVPNENIDRVIKKAGDRDGEEYEMLTYEGYGPNGVAVVVSTLTENRNRTAGEMRHYFDKNSGNLGQAGSVMFLFSQKGIILIENHSFDEDKVMNDAIGAGAEDVEISAEAIEITTEPNDFLTARDSLEKSGYIFASAELEYIPSTFIELNEEDGAKMEKLLDMFDDNEDVVNVWHNWEQPE